MSDLLSVARAKQAIISQTSFTTAETATITSLVSAVSLAAERHCRRTFASTSYVEFKDGSGNDILALANYPIISVARVAANLSTVLQVINTSSSVQRATVRVTSTTVVLRRVAAGVVTDTTLTIASYATLTLLAAAITAAGNGWSATVSGNFGSWPAADLAAPQGAINAKSTATIQMHVQDLSDFDVDADRGWLILRNSIIFNEPRQPDDLAEWTRGRNGYRVDYTAGYATIPEDVQEACAQWVAMLYFQAKRDPGLVQASIVGVGTIISYVNRYPIPASVKALLATYCLSPLGRR